MPLQFIRTNPADAAWDRMQQRLDAQRERRQREGMDRALREGIAEMYSPAERFPEARAAPRQPQTGSQEGFRLPHERQEQRGGLQGIRAAQFDEEPSTPEAAREQTGFATPERVARVTQVESAGDPRAVSPAGALGLMGIMPDTARDPGYGVPNIFELAQRMGRDVPDTSDRTLEALLFDPEVNQAFGTLYLDAMGRTHGGDEQLTYAAYNAGPGAVQRHGGVPPFQETQGYVAQLAGGQPQQPSAPQQFQPTAQPQPQAGGMYDPLIQRLLNQPGGGQAAFELFQQQQQTAAGAQQARHEQYNQMVQNAMDALASGQPDIYRFWARQAGIEGQIPENILQDMNMMRLVGHGASLAEAAYGDDPQQSAMFVQEYITSGGNIGQAFNVAGRPQSRPNYTMMDIMTDDGVVRARVDQAQRDPAQAVQALEFGGQEARAPASSADLPSDARLHQYLLEQGIASSAEEAWNLVRQSRANPREAAMRMATQMAGPRDWMEERSQVEIDRDIQRAFDFAMSLLTGDQGQQQQGGGLGGITVITPEELEGR